MGLFRTRRSATPVATTPEQLFHDLRRDPAVKFLWGHQQQLLGAYHARHLATPNVALELPTGAGKTLVGLLIAEWRRRARGERVIYLCPTRQLCHQVKAHADAYGIAGVVLVGPQRDYPIADVVAYQRAQATAITTYSALFNSNPRLDDGQVLVADDVHAGDEYIAAPWSLAIARRDHDDLFAALVALLGEAIPEPTRRRIARPSDDPRERDWVDLVPLPRYRDRLDDLADLLDEHTRGTGLAYAWALLHGHLEACALYAAPDAFLLRPLIPPTETHAPFAGATQRIFMSATLGAGGELERLTGIRAIARLPMPTGWESRGTGRRLILFPDLLPDEGAPDLAVEEALARGPRTLVLARERREVDQFAAEHGDTVTVVRATDIERDLAAFTGAAPPAALALANRYEGIDLPGEDCRQLLMQHLPAAINLQERFLMQRLGASAQLRERIRTRLTQGLGRCTRDESDYALALLTGDGLLAWCATTTNTAGLHPELQAEIAFGLENSQGRTLAEFAALQAAFLAQDDAWAEAETDLRERREAASRQPDPATEALAASVKHELGAVYALWRHDFARAHESANAAVEALRGGTDLKPYRAFWHYHAAVAADLAGERIGEDRWLAVARDHLERAIGLAPSLPWLATLRDRQGKGGPTTGAIAFDAGALRALLSEWGIIGARFERELERARRQLRGIAAAPFHDGLASLGRMLGCEAREWPRDQGAPDVLWRFADGVCILFEAKTEEDPRHAVSLQAVRQALTHADWARESGEVATETPVFTILITPQGQIDRAARLVAGELRALNPGDLVALFERVAATLQTVRAGARGVSTEALDELIVQEFTRAGHTAEGVREFLLGRPLSAFPTPEELRAGRI